MEQSLQQKIHARIAELPEDLQKALTSAEVGKKIQQIGAKHALHVDQLGALGDETYMVMLGFTDLSDFTTTIAQQLNIPQDKAEALGGDINTEVFLPIRESLQQFMEERAMLEALKQKEGKELPKPPLSPTPTPSQVASPEPEKVAPKAPEIHPADMMLSQKTVSAAPPAAPTAPLAPQTPPAAPSASTTPPAVAKVEPPKPVEYKADPYREPPV